MIHICEQFDIDSRVNVNGMKTQCICFSKSNDTVCGPVTLNNKGKWESKINHLANTLNQRLDDDNNLRKKKGSFIGCVNKLFANFAMCSQLC